MQTLSEVQNQLLMHLRGFFKHRGIFVTTDEVRKLRGPLANAYPEWYALLATDDYEIFIYSDGQTQIKKAGSIILDLEMEDCLSIQALEEKLYEKLNETFGRYTEK